MKTKYWLHGLLASATLLAAGLSAAADKPNILIIMGDDIGAIPYRRQPVREGGLTVLLVLTVSQWKFLFAEHLNDVISELALHRRTDLTDLLAKSRLFELSNHRAFTEPAEIAAIRAGTGILGEAFCFFCKVDAAFGQISDDHIRFGFRFDEDMTCPDLFFRMRRIHCDFIQYLLAQHLYHVHGT